MKQTAVDELYIRNGDDIVPAPELDLIVARGYADWAFKGEVIEGRSITIMAADKVYKTGEKIHIIHVMEAVTPGIKVFVMGPKEIFDEYLDGKLQGSSLPETEHPFNPLEYDGQVVNSPWIDFNYDISIYSFDEPGRYMLIWQPGKWKSNTLEILVEK